MSYILDALRKSDQLRQRGAAPTLLLGQSVAAPPKQPALLQYGLLALVLLGVGIAIGWLRPWHTEQAPSAPAVVAAQPPAQQPVPLVEPAPRPEPAPSAQTAAPARQPAAASAPAAAKPEPRASVQRDVPSAPPKRAAEAPRKASAPAPEPSRGAAAPPPPVVAMAELPLGLQQELPPMSISVHAYSGKPAERLVGINNRLLREGAEVAPGLTLEQITPEGMILSYRGYRFRRGVH